MSEERCVASDIVDWLDFFGMDSRRKHLSPAIYLRKIPIAVSGCRGEPAYPGPTVSPLYFYFSATQGEVDLGSDPASCAKKPKRLCAATCFMPSALSKGASKELRGFRPIRKPAARMPFALSDNAGDRRIDTPHIYDPRGHQLRSGCSLSPQPCSCFRGSHTTWTCRCGATQCAGKTPCCACRNYGTERPPPAGGLRHGRRGLV